MRPSKHHRSPEQAATDNLAGWVLIFCAAVTVIVGLK